MSEESEAPLVACPPIRKAAMAIQWSTMVAAALIEPARSGQPGRPFNATIEGERQHCVGENEESPPS